MIGIIIMILAVLPPALLLVFVWKSDKVEHEPVGFLAKLFGLGVLTVISALVIGLATDALLLIFLSESSLIYIIIDNFIVTALVEEGGKYLVFNLAAWKSKYFDHVFDAVVYAVTISLGFATIENIFFLMDGSITTGILRAFLSIPGHAIDGVYMGYFMGRAKLADVYGDTKTRDKNRILALIVPVMIHGFYDFYISLDNEFFILVFLVFDILVSVCTIIEFRKMAAGDRPLYGFQMENENLLK